MSTRLQSKVFCVGSKPARNISLFSNANISYSSEDLGWAGVHLEVGASATHLAEDLSVVDGHFVGMMLEDDPITIRTRGDDGWGDRTMPPKSIWIHPEGQRFSSSHNQSATWAAMVIEGRYLDDVMGGNFLLDGEYILTDPLLGSTMLSLINLLSHEKEHVKRDKKLTTGMIETFVATLTAMKGRRAHAPYCNGGIAPSKLKHLLGWIQANIETRLTVEAIANEAGLSVSHFSREFKRSIGISPWDYVQNCRLGLARELLLAGGKVSDVACRLQFFDVSHFYRAIRSRHGLSVVEWLHKA